MVRASTVKAQGTSSDEGGKVLYLLVYIILINVNYIMCHKGEIENEKRAQVKEFRKGQRN